MPRFWEKVSNFCDKSGANTAAIESVVKADACVDILIRQNKYLNNNIVEQDHRAIKRITRPMLGFNHFGAPGSSSQELRPCT